MFLHRSRGERYVEWTISYFGLGLAANQDVQIKSSGFASDAKSFTDLTLSCPNRWNIVVIESAALKDPNIAEALANFSAANPRAVVALETALEADQQLAPNPSELQLLRTPYLADPDVFVVALNVLAAYVIDSYRAELNALPIVDPVPPSA
jgi:hypothetical protein